VIISSCSLHITHVCWLAAVLRPAALLQAMRVCSLAAVLRPAALLQAMRVCSLAAVLRPKAAAPLAARPPAAPAPPAPLSVAFGRTAVLPGPNPASVAGDDALAARYSPQRTRASNEIILKLHK
jgi:hypothetical protein